MCFLWRKLISHIGIDSKTPIRMVKYIDSIWDVNMTYDAHGKNIFSSKDIVLNDVALNTKTTLKLNRNT